MLKSSNAKFSIIELKRLLLAIVLAITVLMFTGCVTTEPRVEPVQEASNGKEIDIFAPVVIPYVEENPIEIIYIDETEAPEHQRSYFQISGLLDKTVEDKINEDIKVMYDHLLEYASGDKLVPYRGVQNVVTPETEVQYSYLTVEPSFNCNNLLSIGAHLSGTYVSLGQYNNFMMADSLNIDMNTGDRFSLQDVFTDDVNGMEIVNDAIVAELNRRMLSVDIDFDYSYSQLTLIAPFKGVSEQQKFFLNDYGIHIIIDHNNPEFAFGLSSNTIIVPYYSTSGRIAIMERFFDANGERDVMYSNQDAMKSANKRFLNDYQLDANRENEFYMKDGTEWSVTFAHPANMSEQLVDIMQNLRAEQENMIAMRAKELPISYVGQNFYAYRMGTYVNISTSWHYTQESETQWRDHNYVYTENGKLVTLPDVFIEGFDYETVIKDKIARTIIEYGLPVEINVVALLQDISFTINDTNIDFATKPYTGQGLTNQSLHFSLSYQEIGQENLNIFKTFAVQRGD